MELKGRGKAWGWAATFGVMLAVTLLAFGRSLPHFFIADDLTNLNFVRSYEGSYLDFWVPGRMYSAPVTQSRYMPLHIIYWWALNAAFGDQVWAYHVSSLCLHALVATLLVGLARQLFRSPWPVALATGLIFVTYRLHTQSAVWISVNFRILSTVLFLCGLLFLFGPRFARAGLLAYLTLFLTALLLNPDLVVAPLMLGGFVISKWRQGDKAGTRRFALAWGGTTVAVTAFAIANAVSSRRFPDELSLSLLPDPSAAVVFFINLLAPYHLPLLLKLLISASVVAVVVAYRERYTLPLLGAAAFSGMFWASVNYTPSPRYLYVPAVFVTVAVTQALWRAVQALGQRARWLPERAVGWAAVASLCAMNLVAIHRTDLVHFEYLASLPKRLSDMSQRHPHARVYVQPHLPLAQADLDFFRPRIEFVDNVEQATQVVTTGGQPYRPKLGDSFEENYWYLPWFTTSLRPT